jgi:DNA repair protein RecN (Recombination protein N)
LALGDRAGSEQVRSGAERADVTAEFAIDSLPPMGHWLREQALEGDANRLLLRRVVDANGRSRAFINGHPATINQLREAGERLVDIHGQHAHQSLLRPEAQRVVLDAHAGLALLAQEAGDAHREWQRLCRTRLDHENNTAAREAEREQLTWQTEELSRLALAPGEWETIQSEHSRLAHAASLIEGVRDAIGSLSESENAALGALSGVLSRLRPLTEYDGSLRETISMLESGEAQLREAAYALGHYVDRIELDPKRLQEVEQRLEAVHNAARKFRTRPEALPELVASLRSLLPHGSVAGNEQVEFLVTTNPGTEPRPLAKVASGGELSRISLAIQVITSRAAAVPTLIFDEVDAGIGGAVAEVVGKKLKTLGEERQVLCVTHLPQVAAQAREQWSVSKGIEGGGARSRVAVLDHKSRIEEIARMLGGVAITATTRKHAAEMLGLR